ncbi:hypothetical protein PAHAL_3G495500 [Panicum hallii]|uniref:Uncharacterized protein n=1 Tax=Panicum hallii TaxID=206008 RepID=A0A2S3HFG7_9POAL|nr:hypothetical protein PAHAL_3G495500 [Panicum hallii]
MGSRNENEKLLERFTCCFNVATYVLLGCPCRFAQLIEYTGVTGPYVSLEMHSRLRVAVWPIYKAVGGRWRVTTGFCSCEVARPATGTVSSRAPPGRSVAYSSSGLSSSAPKNATECSSITTKPSCTIRIHPVLS